ncbi:cytochrome P450 [Saccharothrix yanglingensis]|uniref:cytochrome P450 n=1 Tax=Saccharothrix yanglingensis TaxID=659496 RepID=UPI0027D34D82|nr:cytochrome P450 [Saccharothrix yanglingensis]
MLGSFAREDTGLTDLLTSPRGDADWAYPHPRRTRLRERFERRLRVHLERGEPGSLAGAAPADELPGQVPHWLFAFDAAGTVTMRALAVGGSDAAGVQESARLWPTTPMILRESTEPTSWHGTWLPERTTFAVFTPFFHRDPERLPFADRYAPGIRPAGGPGLVPFSGGPGACPGRDLVLVAAGTMLDALREHLAVPVLRGPLPATLDHFGLSFTTRQ